MKPLLILVGLILMLAGLALLGVGALWSGPDGALSGPFSSEPFVRGEIAPAVSPILREISALLPREALDFAFFGEFGYLTTVGVAGLLIFFCGGLILRNLPKSSARAVIRKNRDVVKGEVKKREEAKKAAQTVAQTAAKADPASPASPAAKAISAADEEKLLGGPAKGGIFEGMDEDEKTNHMVSLFHTALEEERCKELLELFRPKLAEYMELYRDDALSMLTKQALEMEIIRRRRQQEDISPDQFRTFDNKITELDREAVCYRYLPVSPDAAPKEAREHFGLVYDRFNHSAVQQKLKSEASDWKGVSLSTAAEVLAAKAPERVPAKSESESGSDSDSSGKESEKAA